MASSFNAAMTRPKELPPVSVDDDLPPPPPSPLRPTGGPPPDPPPKNTSGGQVPLSSAVKDDQFLPRPPNIREVFSSSSLTPPESPSFSSGSSAIHGPPSPNSLSETASRSKKVNPFVDLLETEKIYVDTLSGIIRVRALIIPFPERYCFTKYVRYRKSQRHGPDPTFLHPSLT